MADIATESIRQRATIDGILTSMLTPKDAANLALGLKHVNPELEGSLKFSTGTVGEYNSRSEFKKELKPENINQVSITITNAEGKRESHYFKRIANETGDKSPTGFKASAWLKTDKNGRPFEGKNEVIFTFAGYDGNPAENVTKPPQNDWKLRFIPVKETESPQTKSMHDVGDGKLYPQTAEVPAFVKTAQDNLAKEGVSAFDARIAAHSLGSANATTAALVCDCEKIPVLSNTHLDPVAASLGVRKLKEAFHTPSKTSDIAQQLMSKHGITPEQAAKKIDDIAAATDSLYVVTVDKKGQKHLSHSAQLETHKGETPESKDATGRTAMEVRADNTWKTGPYGRGKGNEKDTDNVAIGNVSEVNVTGQRTATLSLAAQFDPMHPTFNMVPAIANGAPIAPMELLKEREAMQEKPAPAKTDQSSAFLPPHLRAAQKERDVLLAAYVTTNAQHYNSKQTQQDGRKNQSVPANIPANTRTIT